MPIEYSNIIIINIIYFSKFENTWIKISPFFIQPISDELKETSRFAAVKNTFTFNFERGKLIYKINLILFGKL